MIPHAPTVAECRFNLWISRQVSNWLNDCLMRSSVLRRPLSVVFATMSSASHPGRLWTGCPPKATPPPLCFCTIRNALWGTSGENVFDSLMAQSSKSVEPPRNRGDSPRHPGRFMVLALGRIAQT
jgi:hypothetical protein